MPARKNANGQGSVYQRIDGRWCGSGYVLAADGTRKRVYVYGDSHREASDKLVAKLADSARGTAVLASNPNLTVETYLTTWLPGCTPWPATACGRPRSSRTSRWCAGSSSPVWATGASAR